MRNQGVRWTLLLASALVASASGCLQTHDGVPPPPHQKPVFASAARVPGVNAPLADQWQRVWVGELPRPRLEGYVRSRSVKEDEHALLLHWVYDKHFHLAGVMTENGKTTRFDPHGNPEYMGVLTTEQGLLTIFGHETVEPVRFTSMPAPAE